MSAKKSSNLQLWLKVFVIIGVIVLFYYLASKVVTFEDIRQKSAEFKMMIKDHYIKVVLFYIAAVFLTVASSLPIMIPLALVGGYIFGLIGGIYTAIGATCGSVVSILMFRYLFASRIRHHYQDRLASFHKSMEKYGAFYLLFLHYSAVVPFFIINSLMSLSNMPLWQFTYMTFLGVVPLSCIYAFAGRQLSTIHSVSDVFSTEVILSLVLLMVLALIPFALKRIRGPVQL
ncbi:MAG TPA: VTT domain-containing protein [Candidatus Babeliales bacterium]|nr:VTT domain-containing protein [Candidatus Babeliales bacterium]